MRVMELAQVGHQQHRLDDAGADEAAVNVGPVQPPLAGHHGERLDARPAREVAPGPVDASAARIAERSLPGPLVERVAATVESVRPQSGWADAGPIAANDRARKQAAKRKLPAGTLMVVRIRVTPGSAVRVRPTSTRWSRVLFPGDVYQLRRRSPQ